MADQIDPRQQTPGGTDPLWAELAAKTAAKAEAKARSERIGQEYGAALNEAHRLAYLLAKGTDEAPLSNPEGTKLLASERFVAETLLGLASALERSVGLPYFNKHHPIGSYGTAYLALQRLWELAGRPISLEQMCLEVTAAVAALEKTVSPGMFERNHCEAGFIEGLRYFERLPGLMNITILNDIRRRSWIRGVVVELPPRVLEILCEPTEPSPEPPAKQPAPEPETLAPVLAKNAPAPADLVPSNASRPKKVSDRVLAFLMQHHGTWYDAKTVASELGVSLKSASVRTALSQFAHAKRIERQKGSGTKADEFRIA